MFLERQTKDVRYTMELSETELEILKYALVWMLDSRELEDEGVDLHTLVWRSVKDEEGSVMSSDDWVARLYGMLSTLDRNCWKILKSGHRHLFCSNFRWWQERTDEEYEEWIAGKCKRETPEEAKARQAQKKADYKARRLKAQLWDTIDDCLGAAEHNKTDLNTLIDGLREYASKCKTVKTSD